MQAVTEVVGVLEAVRKNGLIAERDDTSQLRIGEAWPARRIAREVALPDSLKPL